MSTFNNNKQFRLGFSPLTKDCFPKFFIFSYAWQSRQTKGTRGKLSKLVRLQRTNQAQLRPAHAGSLYEFSSKMRVPYS